ncbi:hypothetical protein QBC46DRAFT_406270 [Diplogelasinospora grovesii]|uniref:Uncharacterized protein n=1 Tax=Diplogelasinospora grovesii TaxID=303347 RepID=A0AAN6NBR2_9PEZI|nr:hypothetical protein QBC46DRAFT_406270 [Diplogelasinospora grovesii]
MAGRGLHRTTELLVSEIGSLGEIARLQLNSSQNLGTEWCVRKLGWRQEAVGTTRNTWGDRSQPITTTDSVNKLAFRSFTNLNYIVAALFCLFRVLGSVEFHTPRPFAKASES